VIACGYCTLVLFQPLFELGDKALGTRNITARSRYGERANAFREGALGDTDVLLLVSVLLLLKRLRLVLVEHGGSPCKTLPSRPLSVKQSSASEIHRFIVTVTVKTLALAASRWVPWDA
jgi:hypothetical protein